MTEALAHRLTSAVFNRIILTWIITICIPRQHACKRQVANIPGYLSHGLFAPINIVRFLGRTGFDFLSSQQTPLGKRC